MKNKPYSQPSSDEAFEIVSDVSPVAVPEQVVPVTLALVQVRFEGLTAAVFTGSVTKTIYRFSPGDKPMYMDRQDAAGLAKLSYRTGDGEDRRPYFVVVG